MNVSDGGVEPWTIDRLRARVSLFHTTTYAWDALIEPLKGLRLAAVLIPLVIDETDGSLNVWLTKRSEAVSNDKGHVSFPGGMKDDTDEDAVDTALREAEEEIGLERHNVTVLGQLLPRFNLRMNLITPVIGLVKSSFIPIPNSEVAFAFRVPLGRFLSSDNHWSIEVGEKSSIGGRLHFFRDIVNGVEAQTFGITASMCMTVACAVLGRPPDFPYSSDDSQLSPDDPFQSNRVYIKEFISTAGESHNGRVRREQEKSKSKL